MTAMAPGVRDFICDLVGCNKAFNRKSDLLRHRRIHTNERPYQCSFEDCNKSFIQRSALTVHLRTHTGEKPHACGHEGCQKAFSDSSSLARHRRIHTGNRPYICEEPSCTKSFCRKTTLTKHQTRSHPPGSVARSPSEDATSEGSYPSPVATTVPNEQYVLPQNAYYPNASPTHEFYPPHNLPVHPMTVQDHVSPVPHSIPVTSSLDLQHQQYMQQLLQQQNYQRQQQQQHHHHQQQQQQQHHHQPRYDSNRVEFAPVYRQPQPVYMPPTPQGHPFMLSYVSPLEDKPEGVQFLGQPEGTDFASLGTQC